MYYLDTKEIVGIFFGLNEYFQYLYFFWYSEKSLYFFYFRSEQDPFFHETDPKIRIRVKMKRIRKTDKDHFELP